MKNKNKNKKKNTGKMTKIEMLQSENNRLKWELEKKSQNGKDFVKAILFVAFLMLLNYLLVASVSLTYPK